MKKKSVRKGFTITELVIVIAVIAILAAVLIPTFTGIVDKANKSADLQLARNAHTIIQTAKITSSGTFTKEQAMTALAESNISLELRSSDYNLYWDGTESNVVLYDEKQAASVMPKDATKNAETWVVITDNDIPEPPETPSESTPAQPSDPTPSEPVAPTTYTVTKNATNATLTGEASVEANAVYTATVAAAPDYVLTEVIVKVGGSVVNNAFTGDYTGGTISVTATGDIEITVKSTKNQVRNAVAFSGSGTYATNGYYNNARLSTGDNVGSNTWINAQSGYVATGWIPCSFTEDSVIYVCGGTIDDTDYTRFYAVAAASMKQPTWQGTKSSAIDDSLDINSMAAGWTALSMNMDGSNTNYDKIVAADYIRISLACDNGDGANLIITFEKPLGVN